MIKQQNLTESDEYLLYSFSLRKYLNPNLNRKPKYINVPLTDCLEVIAKFDVFTTPVSVFSHDDELWASAAFDPVKRRVYAIISSPSFSLVYNVNLNNDKRENMKIRFS